MNKDLFGGLLVFLGMFAVSVLFFGAITYVIATIAGVQLSFGQACIVGTLIGLFFSAFSNQK